ncbi:MAG: hypothetical protein AABZ57_07090, partial [Candidatus Margulisiibacteriota bacterium]
EIVKRPTGGGIVSHGTDEVTYSVVCPIQLLPEGLMGAYYYISGIIVKALKRLSVDAKIGRGARGIGYRQRTNELCFSNTREYEITFDGKKLVGSAQKRGRNAMLQQGSIQFSGICLKHTPSYDEIALAVSRAFTEH